MKMSRRNIIVGIMVVIVGCAQGRWVKEGGTLEETKQAIAECQSLNVSHVPSGTLSEKIGGNPDLNAFEFENCMRSHGYQWVTEDGNRGQKAK